MTSPFTQWQQPRRAESHTVRVWMAGDYDKARDLIRGYCSEVGACVSLQRTDYIYSGGEEQGLCATFVNYPRFPRTPGEVHKEARFVAEVLAEGLGQSSYLIEAPEESCWVSRRPSK